MDTKTYYFSTSIEDEDLKFLAIQAQEMMQQNDNIAQIFRINNEMVYGHSPSQVLFLMKQNKKSITPPSSSNENSPSSAKSHERTSTPIRCNPEPSNMPRKYLSFDDAEKEENHRATFEFSTPIRQIDQPADEAIPNPTIDKSDEQFASQIDSTSSQESSPSTEIVKMTTNLSMDEKEFGNPAKVVGSIGASSQEFPPSAELSMKRVSTEKYFISQGGEMKISEPVLVGNETPSPVKRTKMCSNPTFGTQYFSSRAEKDRMEENSPEDTDITVSRIPGDKLNIYPNVTIEEIVRDDRKRKSLSPRKRSTTPFKSIPRVIKLAGDEIDIEVVDLEYGASPATSRSKSADCRSDSAKDSNMKSPAVDESKAGTSKTPERHVRPTKRVISIGTSRNVFGKISPGSDDDVSAGKYQSGNPSIAVTATSSRSCTFEYESAEIETDPILLYETIVKFNTLLILRDNAMKTSFLSLESSQTELNFLNHYILNVLRIITTLDVSGKFSTEEFKEVVRDANATALRLINKLNSFEKNIDFEVFTWKKYFQQIEQLKAQYEPIFNYEGKPAITIEAAHVYECQIREIWKQMDGLVMKSNSRRSLFSHIAHDVSGFIKMTVKCLILVGILQSR